VSCVVDDHHQLFDGEVYRIPSDSFRWNKIMGYNLVFPGEWTCYEFNIETMLELILSLQRNLNSNRRRFGFQCIRELYARDSRHKS
jgi:hypothetical protein